MGTERPHAKVWIGLAGVVPREGCELLSDDEGAYVNFLTLAKDEAEYRAKLDDALKYYFLELIDLEDVRALSSADGAAEEIMSIAEELERNQNPSHVRYSTFHIFPPNDVSEGIPS